MSAYISLVYWPTLGDVLQSEKVINTGKGVAIPSLISSFLSLSRALSLSLVFFGSFPFKLHLHKGPKSSFYDFFQRFPAQTSFQIYLS
jgi:hypothetical protein